MRYNRLVKLSGKLLPILLVVLAGVGIVGGVIWIQKYQQKAKIEGVGDRQTITAALRKAVREKQNLNKEWPKSLAEISDDPAVKALGDLSKWKYDFVRTEAGHGIYSYDNGDGKMKEVRIIPKAMDPQNPTGAAPQ